eukprot:CAMPEP_0113936944 /NCGR_PEP_ID=MMETSP1339-20121228/3686_1 /TAXON_ID=94617 /ORGANISM="Fibrocapsa japonica" /LENGTH=208 /DNA_ID=CAMNT_0000939533 /DNA_START=104 /DNA_END=730 /DNA_ORIENTATION=+ /assembly_acc=CAM_ASM_000762
MAQPVIYAHLPDGQVPPPNSVPVQQTWQDRMRTPYTGCCGCFTLRQGVCILASFTLLGGLLSLVGVVGLDFLTHNFGKIKEMVEDNDDADVSSEDMKNLDQAEEMLKMFGPCIEVFMLVIGIFDLVMGTIGLIGGLNHHLKASCVFFWYKAITACFSVISSLGNIFGAVINGLVGYYFAKICWSWYQYVKYLEGNGELPTGHSIQLPR